MAPHQEDVENLKDFVWRICVRYRALNRITKQFSYLIDAVENLGEGAEKIISLVLIVRKDTTKP